MEDMISRKALCEYALNQKDKSVTPNDIMRFPPAQPETHDKRTETHACDCISRQAAIDAIANCTNCGTPDELRKYVDKHSLENGWTGGVLDAMEAVEDIPAADVVPVVHGYWFVDERPESDREVICSVCEEPVFRYHDHIDWRPKYCPHCGAKMDEYCPH